MKKHYALLKTLDDFTDHCMQQHTLIEFFSQSLKLGIYILYETDASFKQLTVLAPYEHVEKCVFDKLKVQCEPETHPCTHYLTQCYAKWR